MFSKLKKRKPLPSHFSEKAEKKTSPPALAENETLYSLAKLKKHKSLPSYFSQKAEKNTSPQH
jgi:hypothetical protein